MSISYVYVINTFSSGLMTGVCIQRIKIQVLLLNSNLECKSQGAVFLHIFRNCVDKEEILKWLFPGKNQAFCL